jgi:hypothetical protein
MESVRRKKTIFGNPIDDYDRRRVRVLALALALVVVILPIYSSVKIHRMELDLNQCEFNLE